VVLTSVPPQCVAVGVPAVIKESTTQGRDYVLEEPR
jgi:serine acetyltransferase